MIRFTAIHDLYQREEDAAKAELGRRLRRRVELATEQQVILSRRIASGQAIPPALREQYVLFWRGEEVKLAALHIALNTQDQAVNDARTALAEAHRRVATIGKLRERDQRAARILDERREQRRSDDRAAVAHREH